MKTIPFSRRFFYSLIVFSITSSLYMLMGTYQFFPFATLNPNWLDIHIPYLPWTVLIYISYYPILFLPFWICKDEFIFFQLVKSYIAISVLCCSIFLFLPIRYDMAPQGHNDVITTYIMDPLREADHHGTNAFPSEHVAFSLMAAMVFFKYGQRKRSLIFFAWGIPICISTLTAKQHYLADVAVSVVMVLVFTMLLEKRRDGDKGNYEL